MEIFISEKIFCANKQGAYSFSLLFGAHCYLRVVFLSQEHFVGRILQSDFHIITFPTSRPPTVLQFMLHKCIYTPTPCLSPFSTLPPPSPLLTLQFLCLLLFYSQTPNQPTLKLSFFYIQPTPVASFSDISSYLPRVTHKIIK